MSDFDQVIVCIYLYILSKISSQNIKNKNGLFTSYINTLLQNNLQTITIYNCFTLTSRAIGSREKAFKELEGKKSLF